MQPYEALNPTNIRENEYLKYYPVTLLSKIRQKLNLETTLALIFLTVILIGAIFIPMFQDNSSGFINIEMKNIPPNGTFWFGTDELGRDLFLRIWQGARISLFVGFWAAIVDLTIGITWGILAGYYGGRIDEIMMRIADVIYAVPTLLKVILFTVIFGPGVTSLFLAITMTGWINMSRIIRSHILQQKNLEYVLASKALGGTSLHIIRKHLLPNSLGPILATIMLSIPSAIFTEAFLSFLGLGIQVPYASWGSMASDGLSAMVYYPWRLFVPSFFISTTLLACHILGEFFKQITDFSSRT